MVKTSASRPSGLCRIAWSFLAASLVLGPGAGACVSPAETGTVVATGGSASGGRAGSGGVKASGGSSGGAGTVASGGAGGMAVGGSSGSGGTTGRGGGAGTAGGGAGGSGGASASGGAAGGGGGGGSGGADGSGGVSGRSGGAGGTVSRGGQSGSDGGAGRGGAAGGVTGSGGVAGSGGGRGGSSGAGGTTVRDAGSLPLFSFFVTSLTAMRALSGSQNGFGGDLRFGETGTDAGLRGADKICAAIAERSMPGASAKQWRAFLSTSTKSAIDRVGPGPWYDRKGRMVARVTADLLNTRPRNAAPEIANDLPNEDGVPNHAPDGTTVDNHDTLTGSNNQGRLYASNATCSDWTSLSGSPPRVGHSWPGGPSQHWINAHNAGGCAAGVNLNANPPMGSGNSVGSGGGYGGIYCFALVP